MKRIGSMLIILGAAAGLIISIYNYFMPQGLLSPLSDIAGTYGALLVIASTALMLFAGLVLFYSKRFGVLAFIAVLGTFLDVLGTGFAAMLLDSLPLLLATGVAGLGWLAWMFGRDTRLAAA
ncbi:MAG: hypothetical protein ACO1OG_01305 [Devosia sp.]